MGVFLKNMILVGALSLVAPAALLAQRIQAPTPINTVAPSPYGAQPSASLSGGIQPFDPYATGSQFSSYPTAPYASAPQAYAPSSFPPPASYPPPPTTPPAGFSTGPPAYFPNQSAPAYGYQQPAMGTEFPTIPYERFLENVAFRYTWLPKLQDQDDALQTQDFDVSATAQFPNFLNSNQPLLVTPAFVLHLWDGPRNLPQNLPGNAYSAYLDFSWNPELTPRLFAELGFRAGAYTDFKTFNSHSLRLQGLGVGAVRLTPTTTIKAGVVYIDRLDKKLFPVVGVTWEPDSRSKYDLVFPYPRVSKYWTTFGDKEVWWYLGGEYGGGSWTIQRDTGAGFVDDQVDINDLRVFGGLEATHPNRLKAFVEIGYVWNRQLVYRSAIPTLKVDDTLMLRTGFNF
ncbi:MAG: hypothetical protein ACIALR_10265 [Blastopirellula sp. JB062]